MHYQSFAGLFPDGRAFRIHPDEKEVNVNDDSIYA